LPALSAPKAILIPVLPELCGLGSESVDSLTSCHENETNFKIRKKYH
jgi:hypothetical protein